MGLPEARELVSDLASAATASDSPAWATGSRTLEASDGRTWLLLDEAGRSSTYAAPAPVTGPQGWLDADLGEPTGFVAAVTSFHTDGRLRQRAAGELAGRGGAVPTRALAVRLLDHVHEVREEARHALLPTLAPSDAGAALGVLLAGRGRQHAASALAAVQDALVKRSSAVELLETLMLDGDRAVRRWAFGEAHEQGVLTPQTMLAVVRSESDQRLRATAAEWLLPVADAQQVRELVVARSAEARLVAVTHLSDAVLVDEDLSSLLVDRSARVREQARWRARRRGMDRATLYRSHIADAGSAPRRLAASLDGLAATGSAGDLQVFVDHLRHASPAVRTAAVRAVTLHGPRDVALDALEPALGDPSPRVSSAAAQALVRLGAPAARAAAAWRSAQPWSRRAAWRTSRGSGGWDRVEADLRAAADTDPQLAALGRTGVRNWLSTSAATTWSRLSDTQHDRIDALLAAHAVDEATTRAVAFHARVQRGR